MRWQGWDELAAESVPVVERCAFCSFRASGPVEEARQAFERHERDRPPPPAVSKRRCSGFRPR